MPGPLLAAPMLMKAAPWIMSGLSFLGGALGNKKNNRTATSTTVPGALPPEFASLQAAIMPNIMKRLSNSGKLPEGYETGGIDTINRTFDLAGQNSQNDLTSRGLGTSPVAGAVMSRHNTGRAGAISNFQTRLPMIQRDMENDDMDMALRALGLGRGTTGSTTTHDGGGSAATGGLGSMASMMGWLMGQGLFGGKPGAPKPTSGKLPFGTGSLGNMTFPK